MVLGEASQRKASSNRRHPGLEKAWEASWRRHHGRSALEDPSRRREASWRKHPGCIWETSGMHQGSISEACGHMGGSWRALGCIWDASGGSRAIWGVLGVSGHKCSPILIRWRFFSKNFRRTKRLNVSNAYGNVWQQLWKVARPPGNGLRPPVLPPNPPEPSWLKAIWGIMRINLHGHYGLVANFGENRPEQSCNPAK